MEVEAPLRLNDFAAANLSRCPRDPAANFCVIEIRRKIQGLREEAITEQLTQLIPPARVHCGLAAPTFRFVDNVVVHERGDVNQFHDHG